MYNFEAKESTELIKIFNKKLKNGLLYQEFLYICLEKVL